MDLQMISYLFLLQNQHIIKICLLETIPKSINSPIKISFSDFGEYIKLHTVVVGKVGVIVGIGIF